MKIFKKRNFFRVESHTPGTYYEVNLEKKTCSCPHWRFRLASQGGECKHIKAVREWVSTRVAKKGKGILEFIKENKEVDTLQVIEKYGESIVNDLIANGELIENQGKIKLLE
tara:strand:- start:648 stop:983 length:336 start_codon:yes stop_codon:yes gene_type:complete